MAEEIFGCKCGFKCVMSQLYKTEGKCPKCAKNHPSATAYAYFGGK